MNHFGHTVMYVLHNIAILLPCTFDVISTQHPAARRWLSATNTLIFDAVYFELFTTLKRNVAASRSWAVQRSYHFSLFRRGLFSRITRKNSKRNNKTFFIWFRDCGICSVFFLLRVLRFLIFVNVTGAANLITRKPRFVKTTLIDEVWRRYKYKIKKFFVYSLAYIPRGMLCRLVLSRKKTLQLMIDWLILISKDFIKKNCICDEKIQRQAFLALQWFK